MIDFSTLPEWVKILIYFLAVPAVLGLLWGLFELAVAPWNCKDTHCKKGHKLEEYDHELYCPTCNKEAWGEK